MCVVYLLYNMEEEYTFVRISEVINDVVFFFTHSYTLFHFSIPLLLFNHL